MFVNPSHTWLRCDHLNSANEMFIVLSASEVYLYEGPILFRKIKIFDQFTYQKRAYWFAALDYYHSSTKFSSNFNTSRENERKISGTIFISK